MIERAGAPRGTLATLTRRELLALLAAGPGAAGATLRAQTGPGRRVFNAGLGGYLIEPDGSVKTWSLLGNSTKAHFGLGSNEPIPPNTAFEIPGLRDVETIAPGGSSTFALLSSGQIVAWGANARGQIGNTPRAELEVTAYARGVAASPTPVLDITDAVQIAAGADHALAVTRDGSVFTWGYNLAGQLGVHPRPVINFRTHTPASMAYVPFPIRIPGLSRVKGVAAGHDYSLALLDDGTVRAWGANRAGQLGDGTVTDRPTPVPVAGVRNAVAIGAQGLLSAAVLAHGTVMTWGAGNAGLGRKNFTQDVAAPTPALVEGASGIASMSVGAGIVLAITNAGTVISWGDQTVGERGHPGALPAPIPGLSSVRSVAAHGGSSLFALADGTILTIGQVPYWARLEGGDPGVSPRLIPLVLKNLKNPL